MKFLGRLDGDTHGSDLCRRCLKTWASSADKLVLASFYFWGAGSSIVASQEGLFRALLVQLLEQNPQIIPRVAALEWEEYCIFNQYTRFGTSHRQLQVLLHEAVKSLVQQEKAKDYTQPDILHYVGSQLKQNEGFARLEKRDPQYASTLIDNITTKSSGVFLWIRLVVKSLLAGLTYDDRISDLQRRLDLLPPDLEDLYNAITESLDDFYFAHAAQYFKFVEASDSPPSALLFSLADEECPEFALHLPVKTFTEEEKEIRINTMYSRAWTMWWENMTAIYSIVQQISPS
ncbi:hypothetical protein ACHAP4_011015 [Fusarium culmorum]